ncbi:MAG: esterase-like activity of phytase family protein [Pseudomonadota bacterium]
MRFWYGVSGLAVLLSACAVSDVEAEPLPETAALAESERVATAWTFDGNRDAIAEMSCQDPPSDDESEQFFYQAEEIAPTDKATFDARLDGMSLAGIWVLESPRQAFGGLSGLVADESGALIAVSDQGQFVSLPMDRETGAPAEMGRMAPMRGPDGAPLSGKSQGDAEGLALRDGVAFVSFERDHRVSAFDLEGCRGAAQEVVLARLNRTLAGVALPDNRGPEGLAILPDGTLRIGIEARETGAAVSGTMMTDGTLGNVVETTPPAFQLLTGLDHRDGLMATVYRAYDPVRGNRISFTVARGTALVASGTLKPPEPVDNIEGIALGPLNDGKRRLWLISDDNFNPRQRTLLFAFDLDANR